MKLSEIPARVKSVIIDQVCFVIVLVLVSVPKLDDENTGLYQAIIAFSIFLNKDIYFRRSIGKVFFNLRVVSAKTEIPASPIQCCIRNVFLLLWPIEVIFILISPNRRLGDFVAGTKVQEAFIDSYEVKWPFITAIATVVGSFALVFSLFTFLDGLGIMN